MNQTLQGMQVREQCDTKREQIQTSWRMPKCVRHGLMGCREYEVIPGQSTPACKIDNKFGPCHLSEAPVPPPPQYRNVKDCYPAKPDPDVLGAFTLFAVPERTAINESHLKGRPIASIKLQEGETKQVTIPSNLVGPQECLALIDSRGTVIGMGASRSSPFNHLFATPRLIATKQQATLQAFVESARSRLAAAKIDAENKAAALRSNPQWQGNRCTTPPIGPVPAEPKTLTLAAAEAQAKGYCASLLMNNVHPGEVAAAVRANQELEYENEAKAMRFNYGNAAACTRRSYFYARADINTLLGESGREAYGGAANFLTQPFEVTLRALTEGTERYLRDTTQTTASRRDLIVHMLDRCSRAAFEKCAAPRLDWEREVARIKAQPEEARAQCERAVSDARSAAAAIRDLELEAAEAQKKLQSTPIAPPPGQITLSAAMCSA